MKTIKHIYMSINAKPHTYLNMPFFHLCFRFDKTWYMLLQLITSPRCMTLKLLHTF